MFDPNKESLTNEWSLYSPNDQLSPTPSTLSLGDPYSPVSNTGIQAYSPDGSLAVHSPGTDAYSPVSHTVTQAYSPDGNLQAYSPGSDSYSPDAQVYSPVTVSGDFNAPVQTYNTPGDIPRLIAEPTQDGRVVNSVKEKLKTKIKRRRRLNGLSDESPEGDSTPVEETYSNVSKLCKLM